MVVEARQNLLLMRNIPNKIYIQWKLFHVSWNASETVFHEIRWKKSFTVYPCLMEIFEVVWRGKQNNLQSEWNANKKCNS